MCRRPNDVQTISRQEWAANGADIRIGWGGEEREQCMYLSAPVLRFIILADTNTRIQLKRESGDLNAQTQRLCRRINLSPSVTRPL